VSTRPVPAADLAAYLAGQPPRRVMRRRDLGQLRREHDEWALAVGGEPQAVASLDAIDAGGVPARLYSAGPDRTGVLVWLHGGAWMLGSLDSCDRIARALACRAGCDVLAVDYRLAPEHVYPAALVDAWTALAWAADRYASAAVGGDSAGGNLAAAAALLARDRGLRLALQLLVYPILDYAVDTGCYLRFARAYTGFAGDRGWGPASLDDLRYMWESYVPDPAVRLDPGAAPMRAETLAGCAPAFIVSAEHDILRGEAVEYARWLRAEDVPVELHEYPGQIHGFFHMLGTTEAAQDAHSRTAAALRAALLAGRRGMAGEDWPTRQRASATMPRSV
jgi:acetyl esterase